jgi:predicted O-methyltransferase YrrM
MNFKRLLPTSAKDLAKSFLNRSLNSLGWKLAPVSSRVLDGTWYDGSVDGLVTRHRPPCLDDAEFKKAINHLAARNAFQGLDQAIQGKMALHRLHIAGQLATMSQSIEGDLVEFGTFRGATAYCMLQGCATAKNIYLFDTFSGIPSSNNSSDAFMTQHESDVGLGGAYANTSVDVVVETLSRFKDRVFVCPGLIPETLQSAQDLPKPGKIAMMHVDLNLSKPTLEALRWALPRWSPGGICLLDDYLWQGFEDQRRCVEKFFAEENLTILALPTGQGIVFNYPAEPRP